nr:unnamed protein product [Callosobruchus chinensis]
MFSWKNSPLSPAAFCVQSQQWSFCLLLIIVVAQIAAGVWGYINRESLDAHIRASVKKTVREDYDRDENVRRLFDTIQSKKAAADLDTPLKIAADPLEARRM